MAVHIGDRVSRKPQTFPKSIDATPGKAMMEGVVVYVHPRGRFHVVEFNPAPALNRWKSAGITAGVCKQEPRGVRESFPGVRE